MFKRRSGPGGLLIVRGPSLRTAPVDDPGAGGAASGGGAAPVTPPAPPAPAAAPVAAVVDVTTTKEYKEALAKATADIEAKARLGTKASAQKEIFDSLAAALGQAPATIDPAVIGKELADTRAENARLQQQIAVGSAARANGGDEDMVTAWLSHKGLLKDLDPTAADYVTKVDTIVKAQIAANPRLAGATTAPPPVVPGNSGAGSAPMAGGAGESTRVLGLGNALAAAQRR